MHALSFHMKRCHLSAVAMGRRIFEGTLPPDDPGFDGVVDMTPARFDILYLVLGKGPAASNTPGSIEMVKLRDILALAPSTISQAVSRLVQLGLVTCEYASWNGRKKVVRLTAEGMARIKQALNLVFNVREGAVDGTDISGCKVALIADTPKVMTDGNWRVGVFVDDGATEAQFDKLVQVFSGQLKPDQYNTGWWKLREQYQGIRPASPRGEEFFDPGAKYHVPSNTPYARYFLAAVLQFQFHRELAKLAGCTGPLHRCSIYGNTAAGERLKKALAMGASRPWPDALEALTGQRQMDATAIADYFAPLKAWLAEQTSGRKQGW